MIEFEGQCAVDRTESVAGAEESHSVGLKSVTDAGLPDSPAGRKIFQQHIQVFSQVRSDPGGHLRHDSGKKQAARPGGRIGGKVPLSQCNSPGRGDGTGVKDLQLGNDHG